MEENNRWKKIKYNLREIIFQSDAKKTHEIHRLSAKVKINARKYLILSQA